MKKLQLLALTMLLSTPFAITYTSEPNTVDRRSDKQDNRQDDRDSKQNDRQERRAARKAQFEDVVSSLQTFSQSDDAVEAKKDTLQATLIEHYQTLQAKNIDNLPQGDAQANLADERDMLKEKLEARKDSLAKRIQYLKECASTKKSKRDAGIIKKASKQAEIDKLQAAGVQGGARLQNLKEQVADIQSCIENKNMMIDTLSRKIKAAEEKKTSLEGKIGSKSMLNQAMQAVGITS